MSATSETEENETAQPATKPDSATSETVLLSVEEAAGILGISPQAVRKRISKGQLPARRDGRSWLVILERETIATSETETGATDPQPRTKPVVQPSQLIAQQQADQMAALVASIQAPLLDRIEAANREAERERTTRIALEAKLAEALAEVEILRSIAHTIDPKPETLTMPVESPLVGPGRELTDSMSQDTLQERTRVSEWIRRIFGR